ADRRPRLRPLGRALERGRGRAAGDRARTAGRGGGAAAAARGPGAAGGGPLAGPRRQRAPPPPRAAAARRRDGDRAPPRRRLPRAGADFVGSRAMPQDPEENVYEVEELLVQPGTYFNPQ